MEESFFFFFGANDSSSILVDERLGGMLYHTHTHMTTVHHITHHTGAHNAACARCLDFTNTPTTAIAASNAMPGEAMADTLTAAAISPLEPNL